MALGGRFIYGLECMLSGVNRTVREFVAISAIAVRAKDKGDNPVAPAFVCYWTKADMREPLINVGYWGQSGHHADMQPSANDPKRTFPRYAMIRLPVFMTVA